MNDVCSLYLSIQTLTFTLRAAGVPAGTYVVQPPTKTVGLTNVAEVTDDDVAVDSYALTAIGPLSIDMYLPAFPAMADSMVSLTSPTEMPWRAAASRSMTTSYWERPETCSTLTSLAPRTPPTATAIRSAWPLRSARSAPKT